MKTTVYRKIGILGLILLGLLQMAGDLSGLKILKVFAAGLQASPAPNVFTTVQGLETFSSRFFIDWENPSGSHHLELTPSIYKRLQGPYNRRNVYGAIFSYGALIPEALRNPILEYALCGERPILKELGIDTREIKHVQIRMVPRVNQKNLPTLLIPPCHEKSVDR